MSNFFSRFYLFSKLSTSLILFLIILFLSYLFIKAYLKQNILINDLSPEMIDSRFFELSDLVVQNSTNINIVKDLVIKNQQSVNKIDLSINKIKDDVFSNEAVILLQKLSKENEELKIELNSLLLKINNLNHDNQLKIEEHGNSLLPINNLINLIKLKLDNGTNYTEEVILLQNLPLNLDQLSYVEKLSILANKDFLGLNNLNNDFNLISSQYLNDYYSKKNNNNFVKYFLNLVTIHPSMNESINDKNLQSLSLAKKLLLDNNLEESINSLALVNGANIFFELWIEQVRYYIEVNNILNKILK